MLEQELEALYREAAQVYFGNEEPENAGVDNLIAVMEASAEDHEQQALTNRPANHIAQGTLLRLAASMLRSSQKEELGSSRVFFAKQAIGAIEQSQWIDREE